MSGTVRRQAEAPRRRKERWALSGDGRPNARARAAPDERPRPKSETTPPRDTTPAEREGEASGEARAPNQRSRPPKGAALTKKRKGKRKCAHRQDIGNVDARRSKRSGEGSQPGERSEPPRHSYILLFPSFQSCIQHDVDFVHIIFQVVIQTDGTIVLVETMMVQEVDRYPGW